MTDTMASSPEEMPSPDQGDVSLDAAPQVDVPSEPVETAPDQAPPEMQTLPPEGMPERPAASPEGKKPDEIRKIAEDYVIPISDEAIATWAKSTSEDFKKYAEQVSSGLFPTFAPQIQQGIPTKILLDPYVQVAQQALGAAMEEPNWTDPKWNAALQGSLDPKTGRPVPMTLDEWRKFLVQSPDHGWDKTDQAHNLANDFADKLHQQFGGDQTGGVQ
jgi:hypothetical protein